MEFLSPPLDSLTVTSEYGLRQLSGELFPRLRKGIDFGHYKYGLKKAD
jgi:hypothetical protein